MRMEAVPSIKRLAKEVAKATRDSKKPPTLFVDAVMAHHGLTPNSHQRERREILTQLAWWSAQAARRRKARAAPKKVPNPMSRIRARTKIYPWMCHDGTGGDTELGEYWQSKGLI